MRIRDFVNNNEKKCSLVTRQRLKYFIKYNLFCDPVDVLFMCTNIKFCIFSIRHSITYNIILYFLDSERGKKCIDFKIIFSFFFILPLINFPDCEITPIFTYGTSKSIGYRPETILYLKPFFLIFELCSKIEIDEIFKNFPNDLKFFHVVQIGI